MPFRERLKQKFSSKKDSLEIVLSSGHAAISPNAAQDSISASNLGSLGQPESRSRAEPSTVPAISSPTRIASIGRDNAAGAATLLSQDAVTTGSTDGSTTAAPSTTTRPTAAATTDAICHDLWQQAYEILCKESPKVKEYFDIFIFSKPLQAAAGTQSAPIALPRDSLTRLTETIKSKLDLIERSRLKSSFGKHEIEMRKAVENVSSRIMTFQDLLNSVVTLNPYAAIAWAGVSVILSTVLQGLKQDAAALLALDSMTEMIIRYDVIVRIYLGGNTATHWHKQRLLKHEDLQKLQNSLESNIIKLFSAILETQVRLAEHYSRSSGSRFWRDFVIADDWTALLEDMQKRDSNIKSTLLTFGSDALNMLNEQCMKMEHELLSKLARMQNDYTGSEALQILNTLPQAYSADCRSHQREYDTSCLPNTRTQLLADILTWCEQDSAQHIFWLCGMAGTGKSTIARTVARNFESSSCLAANFFFSRTNVEQSTAAQFVSTIAAHIADGVPETRNMIIQAIKDNPGIYKRALQEQWQKLVHRPMSEANFSAPKKRILIMVVDALDECINDDDVRQLLVLFSSLKSISNVMVKVLLTSRPEVEIKSGFRNVDKTVYQESVLHNIENSIVENDLRIYFKFHLELIRQKEDINEPWPETQEIETLLRKARKLFIYAATTCKYIGSEPERRLQQVVSNHLYGISATRDLDNMYGFIMENSLDLSPDETENNFLIEESHRCIDPIVTVFEPISIKTLALLTGVSLKALQRRLKRFLSVLDLPESDQHCIQIVHPTFPEFLFDAEGCAKKQLPLERSEGKKEPRRCTKMHLHIDKSEAHATMGSLCLALLNKSLKRNICCLTSPGTLVEEVSSQVLDDHISLSLRYAVVYWLEHFLHSEMDLDDDCPVLPFLKTHFLHWLEVLGLLGKIDSAVRGILQLEMKTRLSPDSEMGRFVHDAKKFVLHNRRPIEVAPLQVYFSLIFAPKTSVVANQFLKDRPDLFERPLMEEVDWPATLLVLDGHDHRVSRVSFSPDGQHIASGSWDHTVKVWDVATGALRAIVERGSEITALCFSSDSRSLASGSHIGNLCVCDSTGVTHAGFQGHGGEIAAILFSPDGKMLASSSPYDKTVKIWDAESGVLKVVLYTSHANFHRGTIHQNVVFAPDSSSVAISQGRNIIVYDIANQQQLREFGGHTEHSMALSFSLDGKDLTSVSDRGELQVWNVASGVASNVIQVPSSSPMDFVMICPLGQLILSGTLSKLSLWEAHTGVSRAELDLEVEFEFPICFSPNGKRLAIGCNDLVVRIWDTQSGDLWAVLQGHPSNIRTVAFSPDGQQLASGSRDSTVRIWETLPNVVDVMDRADHELVVTSIFISHDGCSLAAATSNGPIEIWDARNGILRLTLVGHDGWVNSAIFSSDDRMVVSASADKTVRLWDCITGGLLKTFEHTAGVWLAVFSPDDKMVASWVWSEGECAYGTYAISNVRRL